MRAVHKIKKESHVNEMIEYYGWIYVHKFKSSHGNMRRIARRMERDGKLKMISQDKLFFRYVRTE